jgi:hypothetical protein
LPIFLCKFDELGVISRARATSAPEDAIASADNTRFAFAETSKRELMFSAHAITIALSKNKAQRANNKAAPSFELDLGEGFFIKKFC